MVARLAHNFEPVHTVTGYYDGPAEGVAECGGVPHFYCRVSEDGTDDVFDLFPIDSESLALALEAWQIWQRFDRAYRMGAIAKDVSEAEWGALPDERARR